MRANERSLHLAERQHKSQWAMFARWIFFFFYFSGFGLFALCSQWNFSHTPNFFVIVCKIIANKNLFFAIIEWASTNECWARTANIVISPSVFTACDEPQIETNSIHRFSIEFMAFDLVTMQVNFSLVIPLVPKTVWARACVSYRIRKDDNRKILDTLSFAYEMQME